MKITQAFKMAFDAILGNKVRSFLTVLGVVIGMLAVIILITLGQGAGNSITSQFSSLGTNVLTVNIMTRRDYTIPLKEVMAMGGSDGIKYVSPSVSGSNITTEANSTNYETSVLGVMPEYLLMRDITVEYGRAISQNDIDNRLNVMIIGVDVADELFGYHTADLVGQTVNMLGRKFTIVGVQEEIGTSMTGSDDDRVIIPLSTAQRLLQTKNPNQYYFSATDEESVEQAEDAITAYFLKKLKDEDYFRVRNQSALLDTLESSMSTITNMLAGIAAISLLVGGIGIMNIMLVSVTERTREIGIRKSIGAKRRDILLQFLIESAVISMIGGVIALALGYASTAILEKVLSMEMTISASVIALALGFSAAVGIIFGLYPANNAAKLNPIAALRHE